IACNRRRFHGYPVRFTGLLSFIGAERSTSASCVMAYPLDMVIASLATFGLSCSKESIMQTKLLTLALASSLSAGLFVLVPAAYATTPSPQRTPAATPAYPATTGRSENTIECKMRFTLSGWSAIYKTAHGKGTVTCDNGQTMDVILDAKGGGLTAG